MMWNGKKKAVTFSYDDGVCQDVRLVELFNRYGLKCTFNLNSGIMTSKNGWENNGIFIHRLNALETPKVYAGHEIAVHCLTHESLTDCDDETVRTQILYDKQNLERLFGCEILGMAYPYGTYDERVMRLAAACGIRYSRTVWSEERPATPHDLLMLRPTAHHNQENLLELAKAFVETEPDKMEEPMMLYVWGHSYEFDVDNNWERMEELCRILAGQEDIFYGTNKEVLEPFF